MLLSALFDMREGDIDIVSTGGGAQIGVWKHGLVKICMVSSIGSSVFAFIMV